MEYDDDRFYSGASRGDFLEALTAHAGLGSVVAIEGDSGSGVSMLLGQAVMALLSDMEVIRIDGAEPHDANVVIEALLRHFDIERGQLPEILRDTLANGRMVVVVDNSDELQGAALTTMATLKQKLGARLCYLFGGPPGIAEMLKGADLVVDDVLDLPALAADDVQDFAHYVMGRDLDDEDAEHFRQQSDGSIAKLLSLLQQQEPPVVAAEPEVESEPVDDDDGPVFSARPEALDLDDDEPELLAGEDEERERAAVVPPWRHMAAVAGLLVVVVLLWSVFSGDDEGASQPEVRQLALPVPESAEDEPAAPVEEMVKPLQPSMEPVARLEDLDSRRPVEAVVTENGVVLTPVTDPVMQSAPQAADDSAQASAAETEPAQPEPESTTEPEAAPAEEPATVSGYRQRAWLAGVDDSRWFLQIALTGSESNAQGVLDQIDRRGAYYLADRNGKSVYLVLAGDYSSRQAAVDAKSTLPAKLRESGPFPRKMADIRDEL